MKLVLEPLEIAVSIFVKNFEQIDDQNMVRLLYKKCNCKTVSKV